MRKGLVITLIAAGLGTLAPAAAGDEAVQDLFVARDACGGQVPANPRLSLSTGAFTAGCGSLAGFLGPVETVYTTPTADGVPVTLDTARPVYVAVTVGSDPGVGLGGIGEEVVELTLTGKRGTKTVTLGSASASTPAETMLRQTGKTYEFQLPLDATHAGVYKSITLTLGVGGSQQSGYVDHGGGSLVSLPVLDGTLPEPAE